MNDARGLIKVAVTGGLSSGKSVVCRIFKDLGAYVVSADEIVHDLFASDPTLIQQVADLLGSDVVVNKQLDRSKIGQIVFHDFNLLKTLEELIHPAVYREIDKEYQKQLLLPRPPPLFVAEIPLLFESKGEENYDFTIAVIADEQTCRKRFEEKTGLSQDEFNRRMARQLPPDEKGRRAHAMITNDGSFAELRESAEQLYKKLTS